ncbi:MAG: DUF6089 family protein [Bacteroidetes bacterium]|nr:DUF6089 family protein [Bacteroidota bacterium]
MYPEFIKKITNQKITKVHLTLFSIFLIQLFSFSNLSYSQATLEVGPYGGISYYLGDLNPGKHFQFPQLAYGAIIRYDFDYRWTVKLSGYRGKVKGQGASSTFLPGSGLAFTSPITDISGTVEFNFLDYVTGSRREYFTPYIYAGIGVFWFNPQANGQVLQTAGTEGQNVGYEGRKKYALTSVEIPFGLGVKYSLTQRMCVALFWEMHKTFTDYIDDVSKSYYLHGPAINPNDANGVLSDPARTHEPGMQRGNSGTKDWYSFSGVTVTYKFSIRTGRKCRDIHHK